ncbi:MAG: hypothetical protein LBU07_05590 [Coriobacteriales bacterium]|jgi:hypothetical protein|nr:hypothetical protein [Coriobacteriales bacterium]
MTIPLPNLQAIQTRQLTTYRPYLQGDSLGDVLVLKGRPGPAEDARQPPFSGADGPALHTALVALGWKANNWCGLLLRPNGQVALEGAPLLRLIELIDPQALLVVDAVALNVLAAAHIAHREQSLDAPDANFAHNDIAIDKNSTQSTKSPGMDVTRPTATTYPTTPSAVRSNFKPGHRYALSGRQMVYVEGFEDLLQSPKGKRRAWSQLQALRWRPVQ